MTSLFVDTNIIIDLLAKRQGFYESASVLFSRADNREVELLISALTFANTNYILSKLMSAKEARYILRKFKVLVRIVSSNDKIIDLALSDSSFPDLEDGLQYYTALEHHAEIIITRNKKDFKGAALPVMNANDYLVLIKNK